MCTELNILFFNKKFKKVATLTFFYNIMFTYILYYNNLCLQNQSNSECSSIKLKQSPLKARKLNLLYKRPWRHTKITVHFNVISTFFCEFINIPPVI